MQKTVAARQLRKAVMEWRVSCVRVRVCLMPNTYTANRRERFGAARWRGRNLRFISRLKKFSEFVIVQR
jgi:hypothetical protein